MLAKSTYHGCFDVNFDIREAFSGRKLFGRVKNTPCGRASTDWSRHCQPQALLSQPSRYEYAVVDFPE